MGWDMITSMSGACEGTNLCFSVFFPILFYFRDANKPRRHDMNAHNSVFVLVVVLLMQGVSCFFCVSSIRTS